MTKSLDTETKILAAAREVFTAKGFAGTRMQEVADKAEINKAMLHYYFRSKEKLFKVVFSETATAHIQGIINIIRQDLAVVEKLEALIRHIFRFNRQNPGMQIFMMHELAQGQSMVFKEMACNFGLPDLMSEMYQQINDEAAAGKIRSIDPFQLIIHCKALAIFPFVGKSSIQVMGDLDNEAYEHFLDRQEEAAVDLMRAALQP
ncbi:MAG: TetR/AcrR family transcriptional regulator [Bacteroidota bacterium]